MDKTWIWSSDWAGDEVGFPDRQVVALYIKGNENMYIDSCTGERLEWWIDDEQEGGNVE